jgi:hypothetical protein
MKKFLAFAIIFATGLLMVVAQGHCVPTEHFAHVLHARILPPLVCLNVAAIDSTRARAAYSRIAYIAGRIMELFPGRAQEVIVNRDYLLSEVVINNNFSTYTFPVLQRTLAALSPQRPNVKGVLDNDLFMGIRNRLLIDSRTLSNVGGTLTPQSNVIAEQWPDPITFAPSGCTIADLYSIYNAQWSLQVDRVIYIPGDTTRKFLKVPPFYTNTITGAVVGTTSTVPPAQLHGAVDYFEIDPYPLLSGRLDNKLQLSLQLYPGWNGASNSSYTTLQNVIAFEFDGFTIKNGAGFIPFFNGALDIDCMDDTNGYQVGDNI